MIPIHELRIGNYVLADSVLQRVVMINNKASLALPVCVKLQKSPVSNESVYMLADIHPVPMCDRVLEQSGFVYQDYFRFWQLINGVDKDRHEMNIDRNYDVIDFLRRPIIKDLVSLHQLQNTYFTFRGQELAYTPAVEAIQAEPMQSFFG
jgi:hypothetical protein